jgi:RpiR family carbohydrate utilization transcriptional regulator
MLIRAAIKDLGPGERKVAEAIILDPSIASRLGAAEIGAQVGTSAATVTRACQSMGFDGYPHLRTLLVRDEGAAAQVARGSDLHEHALYRLFAEASRELDAAPATVDLEAFARAVARVANARRILLVGSGGSAAAVSAIALRFMSVGIAVEAAQEPTLQLLACRLLAPGDVVLAISDSGENSSTLSSVEAARAVGASVVAFSSFPRSALAGMADEKLIIGATGRPWPDSILTSNILQTFLLNALVAAVEEARGPSDKTATVFEDIIKAVTGNRRPGDPENHSPSVNL